MRVAIEAASLSLSSGGLARYTSELSLALGGCYPQDEFFLVSAPPLRLASPPPAQRAHPARSFAVDGPALASRRAARPAAHAGAVRTRSGDHGDYAGRE